LPGRERRGDGLFERDDGDAGEWKHGGRSAEAFALHYELTS
jgi:hypothetical protein